MQANYNFPSQGEFIINSPQKMHQLASKWRAEGLDIAFVPTMGALHEGHLSLLHEGKRRSDKLVLSIFVNPSQFAPDEDLAKYPRDMQGDVEKASLCEVDAVFLPSVEEIYPKEYQTFVEVAEVTKRLCGKSRPTHFRGVTTVVQKLFNIVQPNFALFGEKDYQQLVVIKRMVEDLNIPVEIVGMPIVREKDGLAMSSRNAYLSKEERNKALFISHSLSFAKEMAKGGERSAGKIIGTVRDLLEKHLNIDYVEICHPLTLEPENHIKRGSRLLIAANAGKTRLIDNCALL